MLFIVTESFISFFYRCVQGFRPVSVGANWQGEIVEAVVGYFVGVCSSPHEGGKNEIDECGRQREREGERQRQLVAAAR